MLCRSLCTRRKGIIVAKNNLRYGNKKDRLRLNKCSMSEQ